MHCRSAGAQRCRASASTAWKPHNNEIMLTLIPRPSRHTILLLIAVLLAGCATPMPRMRLNVVRPAHENRWA